MPRKPAAETTPDGRVYFIDHRNTRWRIHGVAFGPPFAQPHQRRRLAPGDERAGYRYFIAETGERRSYRLTVADSRELTVEVLEAQLQRAEYPGSSRFDAARHYSP